MEQNGRQGSVLMTTRAAQQLLAERAASQSAGKGDKVLAGTKNTLEHGGEINRTLPVCMINVKAKGPSPVVWFACATEDLVDELRRRRR